MGAAGQERAALGAESIRSSRRGLMAGAVGALGAAGVAGLVRPAIAEAAGLPQYVVTAAPYNATGNGTTPETGKIQSAINDAAAAGGGTVYFPPGTYLTGALAMKTGVTLMGAGIRASTLKRDGAGHHLINPVQEGQDQEIHSWSIQNLGFDGGGAGSDCIHLKGFSFTLFNVLIRDYLGIGLWSQLHGDSNSIFDLDSMEALLQGVKIHHCREGGIYWDGPHDSLFDNVIVFLCGPVDSSGDPIETGGWTSGIEITAHAPGHLATNCHVWGVNQRYAWKLGTPDPGDADAKGSAYLENCEGEGAQAAQVLILGDGCTINGGLYYYHEPENNRVGFELGSSSREVWATELNTQVLHCEAGAVKLTNHGGNGTFAIRVHQQANDVFVGDPPSESDRIDLLLTGSGGSIANSGLPAGVEPMTISTAVRIRNGGLTVDGPVSSGGGRVQVEGGLAVDENGVATNGTADSSFAFTAGRVDEDEPRFRLFASGFMQWGDGSGAYDVTLSRAGDASNPLLWTNTKFVAAGGLAFPDPEDASGSPGTLTHKLAVYHGSGVLMGYVPVYAP